MKPTRRLWQWLGVVFILSFAAGIFQAYWSVHEGLWYARSPAIIHSRVMETLVWLRMPGDIVFSIGGLCLAAYALKLLRRPLASEADRGALQAT